MDKNKPKANLLDLMRGMLDDHLGKEEFTAAFAKVVETIKQLRTDNEAEFSAIHETVKLLGKKLTEDNSSDFISFKAEAKTVVDGELAKALATVNDKLTAVDQRVAELKSGDDGQDGNRIYRAASVRELPKDAIIGDICIVEDTGDIYFNS